MKKKVAPKKTVRRGPPPRRMVVTTRSTVTKTTKLGSSAETHERRFVQEAKNSQIRAEIFDQMLARGDCQGALAELTSLAKRFGRAEAEKRGAGGDPHTLLVQEQLEAGRRRFSNRCLRPEATRRRGMRKFVTGPSFTAKKPR